MEDVTMYGTGTKKMLNMLILDVLKEYSDSEHRLLQQDIIDLLKTNYGMECERRAIRSNIISLQDMGYDIVAEKGYYLRTREFTDAELRLLIDSVFTSPSITDKEAHSLVQKLEKYANKYFKSHVSHIHSLSSGKNSENQNVMKSIEAIDAAISKGKKISFSYLQYGIDFKLHPKRNIRYVVSPYQMVSNRGKYFLLANYEEHDDMSHYRLDRITDVEILKENSKPIKTVKGYEKGLNISEHLAEHVYMFSGESIHVKLKTNENLMDNLIDSFGHDFRVALAEEPDIIVNLKCNPDAFFYWAMQYGEKIQVLEPESMRNRILKACKTIASKYDV